MSETNEQFNGKEHVLNYTAQRYHLTRPKSVGAVMELIRECQPQTLKEWEEFYWSNAYTKTKEPVKIDDNIISELGTRLYEKIHGVVIPEWTWAFENITIEDCVDYIKDVTIRRTFNGFVREKSVVYDNLQKEFPEALFEESDAELDHAGDIDFIGGIEGSDKRFGLQIKPVTGNFSFSGYKPTQRMQKNFEDFKSKYGGNVYVVFSEKEKIINQEVIDQIRMEIESFKK